MRLFAAILSLALLAVATAVPAGAQATPPSVKGLFLLTDYPAITVRPGTTTTVNLKLRNYGQPPERFALSVEGAPAGWTVTLLGGGQPVAAAMPATDQSVALQLRLDVPANADLASQTLTVKAAGEGNNVSLPLTINLAKELPAKLGLTPQLPSLRGTPKSSFDYTLAIKNDSGRNLTVSLAATAPRSATMALAASRMARSAVSRRAACVVREGSSVATPVPDFSGNLGDFRPVIGQSN